MDNLSVVQTVMRENPELAIEDVLDKVRDILIKKRIEIVISKKHSNIFMILRELVDADMTRADIDIALSKFDGGPELISAGLVDQAIAFQIPLASPQTLPKGCFSWRTAGTGKKLGKDPLP